VTKKKKSVADTINESLKYVREFAPGLVVARASLLPFNDTIMEERAGPQPDSGDYDPDEEPFFAIVVQDPVYERCTIEAHVTAKSVVIRTMVEQPDDGRIEIEDIYTTTLAGLWEFLRQLPRPPSSFFGGTHEPITE